MRIIQLKTEENIDFTVSKLLFQTDISKKRVKFVIKNTPYEIKDLNFTSVEDGDYILVLENKNVFVLTIYKYEAYEINIYIRNVGDKNTILNTNNTFTNVIKKAFELMEGAKC